MTAPHKEAKSFAQAVAGMTAQPAGPAGIRSAVSSQGKREQLPRVLPTIAMSRRKMALEEDELIENPEAKLQPSDDCEIIPNPIKTNAIDFGSLLTEYGRSIINSAIDHSPTEAESLKNNIITAKEKVVVKHKTVDNELKMAEDEVRKVNNHVSVLRGIQKACDKAKKVDGTTIQNLKKQHKHELEEKKRFAVLLEEETVKRRGLEVELEELRRDKKRKRESIAAIWEDAERVKLN